MKASKLKKFFRWEEMQFCYWCGVACFGLFVTHSITYRWERDNELKKAAWFMSYMFKFFSYSRPFWCSYSRMKYWKDNMYARAHVCMRVWTRAMFVKQI